MNEPTTTPKEVKRQLGNMSNRKAPGPDEIKIELYKTLIEDTTLLQEITRCLNNFIVGQEIPQEWMESNTILIQKKSKPTTLDLRPIALTNVL